MLYIIGLGLNEKSINLEAVSSIKKCDKIYIDNYTSSIPYSVKKIEKIINKKIIKLDRENIESEKILNEAKNKNICLLIYGSPFFATTHINLIDECKSNKIRLNIIYNASVFDAIAETGLQLYKFGKISSIPKWQNNFKPYSFLDIIENNLLNNSHSLILVDIGLNFQSAINQLLEALKEKNLKIDKILVCSRLGTDKKKIFYGNFFGIKTIKNIKEPFCFVIPSKMHFFEEKMINEYSI